MSSETSIDPRGDDALRPWQLFTLAGLMGATVVVFVSRGAAPSGIVLLSLVVFTAAIAGVATWRTLSPLAGRDEPTGPQMLGGRTRAALEREKALVLRSLKELEFDRAMGKMSEKDFAEMGARLRARATGLIRQLDVGSGYREEIEREIAKRVKVGGPPVPSRVEGQGATPRQAESQPLQTSHRDVGPALTRDTAPALTDVGPAFTEDVGPAFTAGHVCASCDIANDPDAKFCKNCGARMEPQA